MGDPNSSPSDGRIRFLPISYGVQNLGEFSHHLRHANNFDGDRKTDITIWRPGDGYWYTIGSEDGSIISQQWGAGYAPYNDMPVPGDYDGDGITDFAVWRLMDGYW